MADLPDSLDIVEAVMAIEEVVDHIKADPSLSSAQRQAKLRDLWDWIEREFGDADLDDDALGALVRKLGPRPRGQSGAAAQVPAPPNSD
jgi:hypothetical protein